MFHQGKTPLKRKVPLVATKDPFDSPTSGFTKLCSEEFIGRLVLISPTELIEKMPTENGPTDTVRCDFVVLDGPDAPTEYEDTLVFSRVMVPALKRKIDGMVLGILSQGEKKPGKNAPWKLGQPDDDQKQVARDYLTNRPVEDPFATAG